jgi:TetR/AcrR family transcriptional repressor of mexJK operon
MTHGYEATSVDAIADAAGVAKATVYARYADKQSLFVAAVEAKCAEFLDEGATTWTAARTTEDGLTTIGRRFLALVTSSEAIKLERLMVAGAQTGSPMGALFFESAIAPSKARVIAFLEAEVASGRLAIGDCTAAAWQFLGIIKGEDHMRAVLGIAARTAAEREAHIAACVKLFMDAHRPRIARP